MLNIWTLWLLLALAFALVEIFVPGVFFFLSFAIGAGAASLSAFFWPELALQLPVALIASCASFYFLSKIIENKKLSTAEHRHASTNIESLPGLKVIAQTDFTTDGTGFVKLECEVWSAKNQGSPLQRGDKALVLKVEGNKLFIKKMD